ncbi:MAG: YbjN domain-containing protein [Bifidobacteriaceae bacterium]|jgi:hypothetical protein|nr:YbjN domain-containing protein [Bifidobacteriaceae bacterium]
MSKTEMVRSRVQQYLTNIYGSATIDSDGDFTIRRESARGFVRVVGNDSDDFSVVLIFAPVLTGAVDSPELHRWLAFNDTFLFGSYHLKMRSDGTVDLMLRHVLLGDYIDEPELGFALAFVMETANRFDEELQAKFGGSRFHEE